MLGEFDDEPIKSGVPSDQPMPGRRGQKRRTHVDAEKRRGRKQREVVQRQREHIAFEFDGDAVSRRFEKPAVGRCQRRPGKARQRLVARNDASVKVDDGLQVNGWLVSARQQRADRVLPFGRRVQNVRSACGDGIWHSLYIGKADEVAQRPGSQD